MLEDLFNDEVEVYYDTPIMMHNQLKNIGVERLSGVQEEILNKYSDDDLKSEKNLILELPTGGGKTLLGLLIGLFRQKNENFKVLYICPNNQLVDQVIQQSNEYNIPTSDLSGGIKNIDIEDLNKYNCAESIGITNYHSIFNSRPYDFSPDIMIFDDAHSSKHNIRDNWKLSISRRYHKDLYFTILDLIKDFIPKISYNDLIKGKKINSVVEKVPMFKLMEVTDSLFNILDNLIDNDHKLIFKWSNIRNNLHACNLYIENNKIVITPFIPPTFEIHNFYEAKQRIFMSATIGSNGDLKRNTGLSNFEILHTNKNDTRGNIGRNLFWFPTLGKSDNQVEYISQIPKNYEKSIFLSESERVSDAILEIINEEETNNDIDIFRNNDIKKSISKFINSKHATALLSNRLDGIDFKDDICRLALFVDLPDTISTQDTFLCNRFSNAILFNSNLSSRIIQGIGRCTRSPHDFSIIIIIGKSFTYKLISPDILNLFSKETQAEIKVGMSLSKKINSIDKAFEVFDSFLAQETVFDQLNKKISKISMKHEYDNNKDINKILDESASLEVEFQKYLWYQDFDNAFLRTSEIIELLSSESKLDGYKAFWLYVSGSCAYKLAQIYNDETYISKSKELLKKARKIAPSINWLKYYNENFDLSEIENNLEEQIYGIEDFIAENKNKIHLKLKKILEYLSVKHEENGTSGLLFERGVRELGLSMGFRTVKLDDKIGEADSYWGINSNEALIFECKIYKNDDKLVPLTHYKKTVVNENYVKNLKNRFKLGEDPTVYSVFASNTGNFNSTHADYTTDNSLYISQNNLVKFAEKLFPILSSHSAKFVGKNNLEWRNSLSESLVKNKVTYNEFKRLFLHVSDML